MPKIGTGTGTGAGKLLLFGEHSAVYGYPAIGMGLPWNTQVGLKPIEGDQWKLPELLPEDSKNLQNLIKYFIGHFPFLKKYGAMEITIDSDIPIGMGFGSSAALCVAFAKSVTIVIADKFLPHFLVKEIGRSFDFLWEIANRAERLFHGKPSGIDTGLSLSGEIQSFSFHGDELPKQKIVKSGEFYLVIGGLPRQSNTKELVANISFFYKNGDPEVLRNLKELGQIAEEAIKLFNGSNKNISDQFGLLADKAQYNLSSLGLTTPELDKILDAAKLEGSAGGKLSGAGGGGAFYLTAPDLEVAKAISERVNSVMTGFQMENAFPVSVVKFDGKKSVVLKTA